MNTLRLILKWLGELFDFSGKVVVKTKAKKTTKAKKVKTSKATK